MKLRRGNETLIVEVRGRALHVGDTVKTYVDAAKANEWLAKAVEAKRAEGWIEEVPPAPVPRGPEPHNPDLEAAIVRDPDDPAGYAVYGDWLESRGEPRGTLIALMRAGDRLRVRKLLHAHQDRLYGPLAAYVANVRELDDPPYEWRHGFIRKIHGVDAEIIDALAHPSGRLTVELDAFDATPALVDELVTVAPPSLREIQLVAARDVGLLLGDVLALPGLRRLRVWAPRIALGVPAASALERIELWPDALDALPAQLIDARWPQLQRFAMSARTGDAAALAPLFARTDWPRLTHLRISFCPYAEELIGMIAASPFAPQLAVLDLTHSHIGEAQIDRLLALRQRFPSLRQLHLDGLRFSPDGKRRLAAMAKHVITDVEPKPVTPRANYPYRRPAPGRYRPVGE